jgi:hypothetical protein
MTMPWGLLDPSQGLQGMNAPASLLAAPPLPPMPYSRKPSIVDRIAARLFPSGAYQGLLNPEAQQGLQRQGLMSLAAGLLAGGGASPNQRGTLANIGMALQGAQGAFPEMAQRALQLQAYRSQLAEQQAISGVAANHPAPANETPQQRYDRQVAILNDLMTIPGGAAIAEKYAPVLAATKPAAVREPMRIPDVRDNRIGSPTHGLIGTKLIDPDTLKQVGFEPQVQQSDQPSKLSATERTRYRDQAEYTAAAAAAWRPVEQIRNRNPGVEAEVGKILTSREFAEAVPGFRSSGDAVAAIAKAGGSAAAQQYMRAKIEFLAQVEKMNYTGARGITGILQSQFYQRFMPALDELGNAQMRQNELQALITGQGTSGIDEHPEYWQRASQRHGVADVNFEHLLSGGSIDERLDRIRDRYGKP